MAKDKTKELEDRLAAHEMLIKFLFRNLKDALSRTEALRALCESRGVFSHADWEKTEAEALKCLEDNFSKELVEKQAIASDAALLALFEKHQGKVQ